MMKATRASAVVLEEIHIIHVSTVSICIDQSLGDREDPRLVLLYDQNSASQQWR